MYCNTFSKVPHFDQDFLKTFSHFSFVFYWCLLFFQKKARFLQKDHVKMVDICNFFSKKRHFPFFHFPTFAHFSEPRIPTFFIFKFPTIQITRRWSTFQLFPHFSQFFAFFDKFIYFYF